MRYIQDNEYQNIGKKGRDCNDRWDFIKDRISNGLSVDIGSAEGFFVKRLSSYGKVISIEGSKYVYDIQEQYVRNLDVDLRNVILTDPSILDLEIENLLLLSVLHWLDDPDYILEFLSKRSKNIFIEIPDLDCKSSYNPEYLLRIKNEYGSTDNYLEQVSGKKIKDSKRISAGHIGSYRTIYYLL